LGEGEVNFKKLADIFRRVGDRGPYSLEIQFLGPGTTDPTPEFIDQGIAASYRFMDNLGLEN